MCVLWLSSMSTRNPAVCSELNGTANLLMAGYQKCEAAQQSQTRIRYFEKKKNSTRGGCIADALCYAGL